MHKSACLFAVAASLTAAAETSPIVSFLIPAGKPDADECRALVKTVNDAGFDQFLLYPSTGRGADPGGGVVVVGFGAMGL